MQEKCVLCDCSEYGVLSTKLRHEKPGTVVECKECGLVRLLNIDKHVSQLNEYYKEQYAKDYHLGVKSDNATLFESFLPVQAQRVEKLGKYLKPGHKVLEIGSSAGYFLHSIRHLVAEVQGIELNHGAARYAREEKGIPTSEVPVENSDLPLGHYDHIFLFQMLEHVANPITFLSGLNRLLKPGGQIHIEVPNHMDPLVSFFDVVEFRNFFYQEPHLYNFTTATLGKICHKADYKIIEVYGFQQTSIINNLGWHFTRKPQKSRWDCMQPTLPKGSLMDRVPENVEKAFSVFLEKWNREYQQFMESHGYSDMLMATIEKK